MGCDNQESGISLGMQGLQGLLLRLKHCQALAPPFDKQHLAITERFQRLMDAHFHHQLG